MKQGQSLSTIDKERQIGAMLILNMQIVRRFCRGDVYNHIDLNAGSGWNDDYGVKGSPLVFVELAEKYLGDKWNASFYEIDEARASALWTRLRGIPRCTVYPLDNKQFRARAATLRRDAVGSVLADPNGWIYRTPEGIGTPVDEMVKFFGEHRRMDLIANLNLRFFTMARGAAAKLETHKHSFSRMYGLEEMPRLFAKRYGLISNRSSNGHSSFVRLILRNLPTGDYQAYGWYQLDSAIAKEVYAYAELPSRKQNLQLDLNLGMTT